MEDFRRSSIYGVLPGAEQSQTLSPQPPRRLSGAPGESWGLGIGVHQSFLRTRVREERVTPRDLLSICNCLPLGLPLFRAGIHATGPWEAGEVMERGTTRGGLPPLTPGFPHSPLLGSLPRYPYMLPLLLVHSMEACSLPCTATPAPLLSLGLLCFSQWL